ncbi:MAG: isoleucine--tRNA ligase [Candidatus Diapherotrites archaeon]|uniref:Isoleucine--tRNA ligase n=1 Tax=Candidatus Iainarchaeum sp. TaxID=3101447 RepID=A0A8T4C812_9ARCH|nr:isoleucine--tRNA ligase [Candidatus Diapherotrites archaeon]
MQPLPRGYDFKQLEERTREKWKKNKIVEKTVEFNPNKPIFSFLEGPPTANAPPALHHVEMRVFKDVVNRFQFMQGKTVPRKAGWDTHGLPVEVQVEKKLGLKNKREIEAYGTEKFVEECRKDVNTFINEWDANTERLAYWVDLKQPYVTMSNNYIESVWWSLSEFFKRGYLYEGHKTLPFCPRCQTSLSSHEVALGYKTVKDTTAVVKFISKKNPKRAFLAWTTTPWTLPGNIALAVNKDVDYAIVEHDGIEYVLAHVLVSNHFPEGTKVKQVIPGSKLVGEEYVPPFDTYSKNASKLNGKSFIVIAGNFVTINDGTGIVHIAPGFGEDDYNAGKENNLAFVQHVGEDGLFKNEMNEYAGKNHKVVEKELIQQLNEKNLIYKLDKYEHEYPHCWRCNTPLMYYAMKSWFINVSQHRELLKKLNQNIQWTPEHVKEGRFGEWIANAKDWGLSRKRYWGTPLNIWRCTHNECGKLEALGSVAEIRARGKNTPNGEFDLHKPTMDKITLTCNTCKSEMKREPDVIDCWYDSGSAPFAQLHYPFENKELFEKYFPYDFIAEAQDQTRGWFYTLLVINALLFGKSPYKTVICGGLLVDEKGEKMSKSKGNIIVPSAVFDTHGVDATRLQMCLTHPGSEKRIGINSPIESVRPFLNVLWNSLLFAQPYLEKGKTLHANAVKLETEDEWVLSRLETCRERTTRGYETYALHECTQAIFTFVNEDFSRTYIKLVRERAKQGDDAVAYVFYQTFHTLSKLLAPLTPYVSEIIYDALNGEGLSVHTTQWPDAQPKNEELENAMNYAQGIITTALALREKEKINVRWPLSTINVHTPNAELKHAIEKLEGMIQNQVNVKHVHVNGKIFSLSQPLPEDPETIVSLDTTLTPALEGEGFTREITRKIQDLRKKAALNPEQFVFIELRVSEKLEKLIHPFLEELSTKVRARKLVLVKNFSVKHAQLSTETIRDESVEIGLSTQ